MFTAWVETSADFAPDVETPAAALCLPCRVFPNQSRPVIQATEARAIAMQQNPARTIRNAERIATHPRRNLPCWFNGRALIPSSPGADRLPPREVLVPTESSSVNVPESGPEFRVIPKNPAVKRSNSAGAVEKVPRPSSPHPSRPMPSRSRERSNRRLLHQAGPAGWAHT